jgi:hypothetical protein
MGPGMNKTTWCVLTTLMLLTGCAAGPRPQTAQFGDKQVYTAYLGEKPLFSIVTDGSSGRHGVTNTIFIGATYKGQIIDPKSGKTMEFRATSNGKMLDLGGQRYNLAEGQLFLVSVRTDPFSVKQLKVSEEDRLRCLATADERIATFFQGSQQ